MTAVIAIVILVAVLAIFHAWNEVRIFRRGGDVYEWTKQLSRRLL